MTEQSSEPRAPWWRRHTPLTPMNPWQQVRAGNLPRRLPQLYAGLALYGVSMALQVRGGLGVDPWNVLHVGIAARTGLSFGTVLIVVGFAVLALWIPLREMPGLGTISNAVVIGLVADPVLGWLPAPAAAWQQVAYMVGGIVVCGLAGGLYIGSQFGPGPRDGLMTGLTRRTGYPLKWVRTAIEVTVLAAGWLLGGPVGIGTVLFALTIGPIVHLVLPRVTAAVHPPAVAASSAAPVSGPVGP